MAAKTPRPKRYWTCPCGTRNERVKQKCANLDCRRSRPKRRVPKHAVALRDKTYEAYVEIAREAHGIADESCCVCGKPRAQEMRHHRDHGHLKADKAFAKPRGIVCFSCNRLMPRELDLERARLIVAYLTRVEAYYATVDEEAA